MTIVNIIDSLTVYHVVHCHSVFVRWYPLNVTLSRIGIVFMVQPTRRVATAPSNRDKQRDRGF